MSKIFFLTGLFAAALTVRAQVATQQPGTHRKTVTFDGSSTATLVLQARGEGVQIYSCVKDADWVMEAKGARRDIVR